MPDSHSETEGRAETPGESHVQYMDRPQEVKEEIQPPSQSDVKPSEADIQDRPGADGTPMSPEETTPRAEDQDPAGKGEAATSPPKRVTVSLSDLRSKSPGRRVSFTSRIPLPKSSRNTGRAESKSSVSNASWSTYGMTASLTGTAPADDRSRAWH